MKNKIMLACGIAVFSICTTVMVQNSELNHFVAWVLSLLIYVSGVVNAYRGGRK